MSTLSSPTNQPQSVFCINCGKPIPANARFCRLCGASQDEEGTNVQTSQPSGLSTASAEHASEASPLTSLPDQAQISPQSSQFSPTGSVLPESNPRPRIDRIEKRTQASEKSEQSRLPVLAIFPVGLALCAGFVVIWFIVGLGGKPPPPTGGFTDQRIVGTWTKLSGYTIAGSADNIDVLPLGNTLEFRADGFVNILGGTAKYRWQDQTHMVIEYPLRPTVYGVTLSSDSNTLHLEERDGPRFELVRGTVDITTTSPSPTRIPPSPTAMVALSRTLYVGRSSNVTSVAFSPDGKIVASGDSENIIKLWRVSTGEDIGTLSGHRLDVESLAFSRDGQLLASGSSDYTIKLWSVSTWQELRTLSGHSSWVHSVAFSPDGQTLASGSADNTIKLWSVSTWKELHTLSGHSSSLYGVNSVAFSRDGEMLASASSDNTIKLWRVSTGEELRTLFGHSSDVKSVAFSPDGQTLASGDFDMIKLWSVSTWDELRPSSIKSGGEVMAFSPDGQTLASGSGWTITLLSVSTGEGLDRLEGHSGAVLSVAFSPDGQMLASGSDDGTVKLWQVR